MSAGREDLSNRNSGKLVTLKVMASCYFLFEVDVGVVLYISLMCAEYHIEYRSLWGIALRD